MRSTPASLDLSPPDALAAWPRDLPLAAALSDAAAPSDPARSILALPTDTHTWSFVTGWRSGAPQPGQTPQTTTDTDPLADLESIIERTRSAAAAGWFIALSYDLGRLVEPRAAHAAAEKSDRPWPQLIVQPVRAALVFDHHARRWTTIGRADLLPELVPSPHPAAYSLASPRLSPAETYERSVERALAYIRAGDAYQINLTHRVTAAFEGSARALAADLFASARPWHGVYLELDTPDARLAAISASPELFLDADLRTGRVRTRPMKGTRPATADPGELFHASKDRAELDMITDLMRNDLGRVCRPGSIRVDSARDIERHASGVLQATSTVSGDLREGVGLAQLLRATFPPGSVTGAPKIRAMQIIDELESAPRHLYTGAIGYLSADGRLSLSVAIRTALLAAARSPDPALDHMRDATLDLGVGAGLVADSDPAAEWRETLDKARFLLDRISAPVGAAPPALTRSPSAPGVT